MEEIIPYKYQYITSKMDNIHGNVLAWLTHSCEEGPEPCMHEISLDGAYIELKELLKGNLPATLGPTVFE